MDELYLALCTELSPHYDTDDTQCIATIIFNDKYEAFWTDATITCHQVSYIMKYVTPSQTRDILRKYKFQLDIIINNDHILSAFAVVIDYTQVLSKYDNCEQMIISQNIITRKFYDSSIIIFMIKNYNYSIYEWTIIYKHMLNAAPFSLYYKQLIADHIYRLNLYDSSLRNIWIMTLID